MRAYDLMEDLRRAQEEDRQDRRLRMYLAPKVLILDEFGIWPYDRVAATALFTLVSARYERGTIILTSNRGLSEWGEVLGSRQLDMGYSGVIECLLDQMEEAADQQNWGREQQLADMVGVHPIGARSGVPTISMRDIGARKGRWRV